MVLLSSCRDRTWPLPSSSRYSLIGSKSAQRELVEVVFLRIGLVLSGAYARTTAALGSAILSRICRADPLVPRDAIGERQSIFPPLDAGIKPPQHVRQCRLLARTQPVEDPQMLGVARIPVETIGAHKRPFPPLGRRKRRVPRGIPVVLSLRILSVVTTASVHRSAMWPFSMYP